MLNLQMTLHISYSQASYDVYMFEISENRFVYFHRRWFVFLSVCNIKEKWLNSN